MKIELIHNLEIALCKIESATYLLNIVTATMESGDSNFHPEEIECALQAISDYTKVNVMNASDLAEQLSKVN